MWKYNHTSEPDELYHYGILGMKWGVRRYQNKDGTLTPAGKKRYGGEEIHEDYKKAHSKKSVKVMSNQELKDRNQRLNAEKQYNQLTKKDSPIDVILKDVKYATAAVTTVSAAYKVAKPIVTKILEKNI